MSATVLPMPARDADESWLTPERMTAYFVALSVNPDLRFAAPLVRDGVIDRVIAGIRQAVKLDDALDAQARAQCVGLMRMDHEARLARIAKGGW